MIPAHPDQRSLTHYMVLGHKTPVTGVLRSMPVVPHHPVIVHLEGVLRHRLTIEQELSVLILEVVVLIYPDRTLIDRIVLRRQLQRRSFGGDPYRPEIIP